MNFRMNKFNQNNTGCTIQLEQCQQQFGDKEEAIIGWFD